MDTKFYLLDVVQSSPHKGSVIALVGLAVVAVGVLIGILIHRKHKH